MRTAIRWTIAITLTAVAFALAAWLSVAAGADEGWALGIGTLAGAAALAAAQAWATSHHPPNPPAGAPAPPIPSGSPAPPAAPETSGNAIGGSATIAGPSIQAQTIEGGVHVHPPAPHGRTPAASGPEFPIRVGDVPQRPPAFQLREDLFDHLAAAKPVAVVQALTGARGVGKTQLAAELARRCIDDGWRVVAWIAAEEPGQAMAGLTELAEKLGLRYAGEDATSAVRKARHWLESAAPEDCLVVFDNAVDVDGLRQCLPATGHARIIITSNQHAFGDLGEAIDVDVFTPVEAAAFLRSRVGPRDVAGAERLAEEVGRLPVVLAQAAGVISREKLTYDTFITRLREQPIDEYLSRGSDPYPLHAAQAVLLAVATAEATDALARPLLDLLAVLSPEGLPRSLVHAATRNIAASPVDVDRSLGRLSDASLITLSIESQRAVMHRFTQRVVRERTRRDGTFPAAIAGAARLLGDALIPRERAWSKRTIAADLVQQITALWDSTKEELTGWNNGSLTDDLLMLRRWVIRQLVEVSSPAQAIELGIGTLTDHERLLGNDHSQTQR